jgi:hypothetical protein
MQKLPKPPFKIKMRTATFGLLPGRIYTVTATDEPKNGLHQMVVKGVRLNFLLNYFDNEFYIYNLWEKFYNKQSSIT